jgi:hypothetical protein
VPNLPEAGPERQLLLLPGMLQEELGWSYCIVPLLGLPANGRPVLQNDHKAIHKTVQNKNGSNAAPGYFNPFPTYSFTGSVRPVYPLSPRRTLPKSIRRPDWAETGIPKAERRLNRSKIDLLDAKGQEAMRKVCRLAREVLDITAAEVRPGVSTDYLDEVCHKACVERDVSTTLFSGLTLK